MMRRTPDPSPGPMTPEAEPRAELEGAPLESAHRVETAGAWMGRAAVFLALGWIATVALGAVALGVLGAFGSLTIVEGVAIVLLAILPAGLLLFAGAVAREGVRAQAQARRLADAADRLMNPSPVAEAATRRLGISVRGEIAALDRSLAETLSKLESVAAVVARQRQAVNETAAIAQQGAGALVGGLERERAMLSEIGESLVQQAARLGQSLTEQSQAISTAAQQAEQNLMAADKVLAGRLAAVDQSTSVIGERTGRLASAAAATADSTQRLEAALAGALDTLAQATSLTEAAKKSTEAATLAANATAGAVRDTTNRAVEDAKRVAELIRAEAQAVEREAAAALERLRAAADAARMAAVDAREATGANPARPPERVPTLTPSRAFTFAPTTIRDRSVRLAERRDAERREAERLDSQRFEAQVARSATPRAEDEGRGPQGLQPLARTSTERRGEPSSPLPGAQRWNWRDMRRRKRESKMN